MISRYWKAINAALLAGLTAAGVALLDGHIDAGEWITIAVAALATSGGVAITTNAPAADPLADVKATLNEHAGALNAHADRLDQVAPPAGFAGAGVEGYGRPELLRIIETKPTPHPGRQRSPGGQFAKES